MNRPASSRISGTRFIENGPPTHDRVSLGSSFRGQNHPITGERRLPSTNAIDAVSGEQQLTYCAPATLKLAEDLFERWNDALKTLDANKVAECYAEDAVLLPTVSNIPRTNREEITDYFIHFLEKKPEGIVNQRNVKIGCNKITDAGIYTFKVDDHGVMKDVPARYTFVYVNYNGVWLISHHHSSVMPA